MISHVSDHIRRTQWNERLRAIWTLTFKETLRFLAVPVQTLGAPVITSSLYLFIFGVNLGGRWQISETFQYVDFVVPGLMMMNLINNTFMNVGSSLFFSRYIGNIVDLLVTPLNPTDWIVGYTGPAILRGLLNALGVYLVSLPFASLPIPHPWHALGMLVLAGFLFAQLGIVASIYSDSFENLSMYNTFLLLPLVYLGGLFYPTSILPEFWRGLTLANPIYYMMDGFRQSMMGYGEIPFATSFSVLAVVSVVFFFWARLLLATSKKLRN